MSKQLEHGMQCRLIGRTRIQYRRQIELNILHIQSDQNAEPRDPVRGRRLKAAGMVAGVPDVLITGFGARVLWIELKAPGGKISKSQRAWHETHRTMGFQVEVCDDEETAWALIQDFARVSEWAWEQAQQAAAGAADGAPWEAV